MSAAPELIPSALKMIAALAAVLGALFVAVYAARRYVARTGTAAGERLVRVIATHPIGVKKSVILVEIPGAVLVLGIAGERIALLGRIEAPEILDRICRRVPEAAPSFSDQLSRLTARWKAADHDA